MPQSPGRTPDATPGGPAASVVRHGFARFTRPARRAVATAGTIALDAGHPALTTGVLLLALAETRPFDLASFTATREEIGSRVDTGPDARALLATLGIDLEEVRRRTRASAGDPDRWRLTRSPLRPLRMTLHGPLGSIPLAGHMRKVVEVARRRPGPVTGESLLWGLLADGGNGTAAILRSAGVDVCGLVRELGMPIRRAA
ncbi:Clp protease N-terminal domain-containing protein [Nonomuraea sp. NPDC050383]|uniref:Clp protease N-terminal domain-containing protein n=1 Tax=Nonomuraea sp. NPDC050383 TaxID=3364362 RepID=UPI003787EFEA